MVKLHENICKSDLCVKQEKNAIYCDDYWFGKNLDNRLNIKRFDRKFWKKALDFRACFSIGY